MTTKPKSFNSMIRHRIPQDWYPAHRIQHEVTIEFVSPPENLDGSLSGTVRALQFAKLPISREVNVRESHMSGSVSESRTETLFTDGTSFRLKNNGIHITVSSAEKVGPTTYKVKFVDKNHGIADGGGTFLDLQKALKYYESYNEIVINNPKSQPDELAEAKSYRQNLDAALVPIKLHVGLTRAEIQKLTAGKNNANKVSEESQMDQAGVFDTLKEVLGPDLSKRVAWYQNRGKERGAEDMDLKLGTLMKLWLGLGLLHNVDQSSSYSSLGSTRKSLRDHHKEEAFVKGAGFVLEFYKLYEEVCKLVSGFKKTKWTGQDRELVKEQKCFYPLTGGETQNTVHEPAVMPIVMAMRAFVEPDYSGWVRDPFDFLEEYGTELVAKVFEDHDALGGDATSFGKKSRPFSTVDGAVAAILQREARRKKAA